MWISAPRCVWLKPYVTSLAEIGLAAALETLVDRIARRHPQLTLLRQRHRHTACRPHSCRRGESGGLGMSAMHARAALHQGHVTISGGAAPPSACAAAGTTRTGS